MWSWYNASIFLQYPLRPFHKSSGTFRFGTREGCFETEWQKSFLIAVVLSWLILADHYPTMKAGTPMLNLSCNCCGYSSKTSEFHSSPFLHRDDDLLDPLPASQSTLQIFFKMTLIWFPCGVALLNHEIINPQCHAFHVWDKLTSLLCI